MTERACDLIIIGAGAAGLMAAAEAGHLGLKVLVLEGQREAGLKLLITGGGRCNVTNARISAKDFHAGSDHILRHVLETFSPQQAVAFFEKWGAPLALQASGEFFSADDKARTVRDALIRAAEAGGARILCQRRVMNIARQEGLFNVVTAEEVFTAQAVLIAAGGLSYPGTGSDGAGYRLAGIFGHRIIPTHPALTPLAASRPTFEPLSGIVVPVRLSLWTGGRKVRSVDGPLLFTHQGFSGPAAMEMSGPWSQAQGQPGVEIRTDFFPAQPGEGIDIILDPGHARRSVKNAVATHLPERLAQVLIQEAGIDGQRLCGELSHKEKKALTAALRAHPLPIGGTMGYPKAEVTAGGVDLNELKGATLESRLQEGLYFAGEVLDVDGRIGGFNLHWAWASGVAAARAIFRKLSSS